MLVYASYGRSIGLDCPVDDDYWKALSKALAKSEKKAQWKRGQVQRADQKLLAEHKRETEIVMQLRDAIAVAVSDEDTRRTKTVDQKRTTVAAILEAAGAMGVAAKVRGDWKAHSTRISEELVPTGKSLTEEMMEMHAKKHGRALDSDDGKYDPARMETGESDEQYFARLKIQSDPVLNDTQMVLDVTGWVVARPTVEGANVSNHPIAGEPVALPRRAHLLWPSAIRFQAIMDDPDKDYLVVDEYEKGYKIKQDLVPARQPSSRMPVCGESYGYVMPAPVLKVGGKIVTETNEKLRALLNKRLVTRTKRNFELQAEIGKALMTLCGQVVAFQEVVQGMRELVPVMESFNIAVPSWLTAAKVEQSEPYRIPESELAANRQEMQRELELRRKTRLNAYYSAGKR